MEILDYTRADGAEASIGAETLRAHLSSYLPDYMGPSAYLRLDQLPLTVHAKVDPQALPAPDIDARTRNHCRDLGRGHGGARRRPMGQLFRVGGHSLRAVRVTTSLQEALKVQVTLTDLFEKPVAATLAEL